jgi:hypothetical protein
MSKIMKSINNDFGGSWNQSQFHQEILAEEAIVTPLVGINYALGSDNVEISFALSLTASEVTSLNNLVANHVAGAGKDKVQFYTVAPKQETANYEEYFIIARFDYIGSSNIGNIDFIEVLSKIENDSETYSIKVINSVTLETIAEKTGFNNTEYEANDLGTISSTPEKNTTLEVYVKKSGHEETNYIHVDQIKVFYGN